MSDLVDILLGYNQRISELERRIAATSMRGKVASVDPANGTARIEIGQDEDGQPVLSPPLPYAQTAGALKIHDPPSVGQQMEISAASGDLEQGTLRPLHWSDANAAPSSDGNEHVIKRGPWTVTFKDASLEIKAANLTALFKPTSADIKMNNGGRAFVTPTVSALMFAEMNWIYTNEAGNWCSSAVVVGPKPDMPT